MSFTPYRAAQIANALLKNEGIEKEIKPQMMYNYRKNNIIKCDANGEFNEESFGAWLTRYIEKQNATKQLKLF